MKERNYSLDILRIAACIAVLSYHLPKKCEALKAVDYCLITPALAIFFVLMGYLTSAPDPAEGGLYPYYRRKLLHLGLPLYVFTVFYGYVYYQRPADLFCLAGLRHVARGALDSLVSVFAGPNMNQLWFLYDILAIYLIWPFVRAGLDAAGEAGQKRLLLLIVFLQLAICLFFLKTGEIPYFKNVIYLTGWILYPILGHIACSGWLWQYDRLIFIGGAISAALNAYMSITEKFLGASPDAYSFSPLMLVEVMAVFRAFLLIKIKKGRALQFLSERTFTAYLLGAYTTFLLDNRLGGFFRETVPGMIFTLIILVVLTFSLAAAVDLILLENLDKFANFVITRVGRPHRR